ncbi:MAG: hypothetical protein LBE51_20925 [Acidovorax sp.]|jgi:hypothetical protein|nr:hypothetical protein [Acidovorax sp.]
MTQAQQPEALRCADAIDSILERYGGLMLPEIVDELKPSAAELRRLHARVQELEFAREIARACAHNIITAAQAQRAPLTAGVLEDWKRRVNTLAACSLKADRYRVGSALKHDIADAIAAMTQQ